MKSQFILEFSKGRMQTEFPATADPGGDRASSITYESPRLSVAAPFKDRKKGADRAICRTVNGIVQVKLLNKDILQNVTGSFFGIDAPVITAGLYGESAGIEGAIAIHQYYLSTFSPINAYSVLRFSTNGDLGFKVLSSYANLMQNIFIRVVIQRGPATAGFENTKLKIDALCSGVLMGSDLR